MTHDELLAKINVKIKCDSSEVFKLYKALRAVVELHFNDNEQCGVCRHEWDYPCETIKAIEKELK